MSAPNLKAWLRAVSLLALLAVLATGWSTSLEASDAAREERAPERSDWRTGSPVSMRLVLYDPYQCVRMGKRVLVSEVERIFGDAGIRVAWISPNAPLDMSREAAPLRAVILPTTADHLGIRPRAMGAAIRNRSGDVMIYIFWPRILRTLGIAPSRIQGGARDAALAAARVLVHEIVHAALPEMPHRNRLMSGTLRRHQLVRQGSVLDEETGKALWSWLRDVHLPRGRRGTAERR